MIALITNNIQEYLDYLELHKLSQKDCLFVNRAQLLFGRRLKGCKFLFHAENIKRKEMQDILYYLETHNIEKYE